MIETDKIWLDEHRNFLYVSSYMSKPERQELYNIYNRLTGENKRPNGCGKCLQTTIKTIKYHYEKQESNN